MNECKTLPTCDACTTHFRCCCCCYVCVWAFVWWVSARYSHFGRISYISVYTIVLPNIKTHSNTLHFRRFSQHALRSSTFNAYGPSLPNRNNNNNNNNELSLYTFFSCSSSALLVFYWSLYHLKWENSFIYTGDDGIIERERVKKKSLVIFGIFSQWHH